MNTIIERLKEMRKLRKSATPGPWGFNENKPSVYTENPSDFSDEISADMRKYDDRVFIASAANNWLTLITCLEKAVEAIEDMELHSGSKDDIQDYAKQTITEISNLLK